MARPDLVKPHHIITPRTLGWASVSTLRDRLKQAREARGLSQREAATALGVTPASISGWERGHYEPTTANIVRMAALYKIPAAALRFGADAPANGDVYQLREAGARAGHLVVRESQQPPLGELRSFSSRARSFINRFLAELADAGVSEEAEAWARRVLSSPDNYGFNAGGNTTTLSEEDMLRDMEGMSIGIRHILRARGHKNLPLRGSEP